MLTAEAAGREGAPGCHMVEAKAIETPADQIRRDGAPSRSGAARQPLRPEAALADDQAEAVGIHQRDEPGARPATITRRRTRSDRNRGSTGWTQSRRRTRPRRRSTPRIGHESPNATASERGGMALDHQPLAFRGRAWGGPEQLLFFILGNRWDTKAKTLGGATNGAGGTRSRGGGERGGVGVEGSASEGPGGVVAGGAGAVAAGVGGGRGFAHVPIFLLSSHPLLVSRRYELVGVG